MAEFHIEIFKNRTTDYQFTLYQADGVTGVALANDDVVRFKLGTYPGVSPSLDIDSVSASSNGSVVTVDQSTAAAKVIVRIAQADTSSLVPKCYLGELSVVDNSETAPADAIKHAENGTVLLTDAMGGDVGTT